MKYMKIEKNYFILKMKENSRLEFMEFIEKNFYFSIEKINFIWNNSNKNEIEFYSLFFDYLYAKSKKDENIKYNFEKLITYFNL